MKDVSFRLILVRHAQAYDRKAWSGHDLDRPLISKGEKRAKNIGKNLFLFLNSSKETLEACYSSEALRSYMTAKKILKSFPCISCIRTSLINPETGVAGYLSLIKESQEEGNMVVAIVGHECDLSKTVAHLCGRCKIRWKKGRYFVLDLIRGEWHMSAT